MSPHTLPLARTTACSPALLGPETIPFTIPADALAFVVLLLGLPVAAALGTVTLLAVIRVGVRVLESPPLPRRGAQRMLPAIIVAALAALLWSYGPLVSAAAVGIGHVLTGHLR